MKPFRRDAVGVAVAALRRGTIPTLRPIPFEYRGDSFVGETARRFRRTIALMGLFLFAAVLFAFVARRMGRRIFVPGAIWVTIGVAWVILGNAKHKPLITDIGSAMAVFGLVLTVIGIARFVHGAASRERPDTDR